MTNQLPSANSPATSIILVSRPGIMRQSLQTSLASYAWLTVVAACGDGLTALKLLVDHQPRLLIIDSNLLEEEVAALLATVKSRWPAIRCLALLQSNQHEGQTLAAGADAILLRDNWTQHSPDVLQQLIQSPAYSDAEDTE